MKREGKDHRIFGNPKESSHRRPLTEMNTKTRKVNDIPQFVPKRLESFMANGIS